MFSFGFEKPKVQTNFKELKSTHEVIKIDFPTVKYPNIIQFCCSGHILFLSSDNRVYSKGKVNYNGELGLGKSGNTTTETHLIEWFVDNKIKIIQIAVGGQYSTFLDEFGNVYGCGHNIYGDNKEVNTDIEIPTRFKSIGMCREIICGGSLSIFVMKDGTFVGSGMMGDFLVTPNAQMELFKGEEKNIKKICLGGNHGVVLKKNSEVWVFGKSECGQIGKLGKEGRLESFKAEKMDPSVFNGEKIVDVFAKNLNTFYFSSSGNVYSSGIYSFEFKTKRKNYMKEFMEIGILRPYKEIIKPAIVNKNISKRIVHISCMGYFGLALCENGNCYTLGSLFHTGVKGRNNKTFFLDKRFFLKSLWEENFSGKLFQKVKSLSFVNVCIKF